jgi:hypothetical protein
MVKTESAFHAYIHTLLTEEISRQLDSYKEDSRVGPEVTLVKGWGRIRVRFYVNGREAMRSPSAGFLDPISKIPTLAIEVVYVGLQNLTDIAPQVH